MQYTYIDEQCTIDQWGIDSKEGCLWDVYKIIKAIQRTVIKNSIGNVGF